MRDVETSEDGMVLIIALGLIALVSLLALSMVSYSKSAYRLSSVESGRVMASYSAEGAAARMIWLLRDDIAKHPNRVLGTGGEVEDFAPRYPADGTEYEFVGEDGATVSVSLSDAASGVDVSGTSPNIRLRAFLYSYRNDNEWRIRYESFLNALGDYVDTNDLSRQNGGRERADYSAAGKYPLPRNGPIRYKWEICWTPGCSEFFKPDNYGRMSDFRVVAPRGLVQPRGRVNFFSATRKELRAFAKLSDTEVDAAVEARSAWTRAKEPLSENLPVGLLGRLRGRFAFRESGCYALLVKAPVGMDGGVRVLSVILRVNRYLATRKNLEYYEWRFLR
ncbi:MAG: hypothetical protein GXP32_06035 [Kiritimatiellaeota bacterium]|nr:hypothetical protein [Kiritimatiellota bacterium]